MPRIVTYECIQCGTEVVVTETLGTDIRPIYCCGLEITEVSSEGRMAGRRQKVVRKTAKKAVKKAEKKPVKISAKKTVAKKAVEKKKPVSKKKTTKKK